MDLNILDGVLWYLAFLFSTTFHEASHSFLSMKLGDLTAYEGGQVTLNPIPHIRREPFGTVIVPILSYLLGGWMIGWASAPYNYDWAYKYPKKSAAVSAGGPVANFILLLLSAFIIHLGINLNVFFAPEVITISSIVGTVDPENFAIVAKFISILFSLNLILFVFNLIPVPPLDGSGMIPLYLNDELGRKYMNFTRNSGIAFLGIFVAWKLFDLIYFKIHLFAINLLYPGSNYQ